jgi:hypothetical protein
MPKAQKETLQESAIDEYETLAPLTIRMHGDIQTLTGKKQDGILSKTRILMINKLLERARVLLAQERSLDFLEVLDEDALPQNADAMLVIGQYVSALHAYKTRHTAVKDYKTVWLCNTYREVVND